MVGMVPDAIQVPTMIPTARRIQMAPIAERIDSNIAVCVDAKSILRILQKTNIIAQVMNMGTGSPVPSLTQMTSQATITVIRIRASDFVTVDRISFSAALLLISYLTFLSL